MASEANLIFKEEVFKTMGAAMDVHRILGPGFLEPVYQEALAVELIRQEVPFKAQSPLKIRYRDGFLEKRYIADFIVFDQIIVEIKALPKLGVTETAQLLNYLRVTELTLGLLINFGADGKLEWKRLANTHPSRPL